MPLLKTKAIEKQTLKVFIHNKIKVIVDKTINIVESYTHLVFHILLFMIFFCEI